MSNSLLNFAPKLISLALAVACATASPTLAQTTAPPPPAFGGTPPPAGQGPPAPAVPGARAGVASAPEGYVLGSGDKIQITVYGETGLTGEFFVSGAGDVAFPLIGNVHAAGLTIPAFSDAVRAKLEDGYIRDPKVSAQVLIFRPFYILGEVARPGEYPYSDDLTLLNAVAEAGGFTYRAQKGRVMIRHAGGSREVPVKVDASTAVQPGDTIRVRERFF